MAIDPAHPWWQTGVFYNLYVRSFKDSNGDGIGDLTGVLEKLDYLADTLGVDVLWLSGILASPWKEFGFDVSDFKSIHPAFGTLETLEDLISQAHRRGLKVILDFIPNHTSDQHDWFLEARSSRDNPKRDWYIWRDPKPDGTPPNNWLSLFGGPAWEWDERTWQYYLHTFLKEQPDLNWRNPHLKAAMFDVARFWLGQGIDGFRVDAAHHILKDPELRDNPPAEPRTINGKKMAAEFQQHRYDREAPGLHEIYREFRQVMDSFGDKPPRAAFAEVYVAGGWPEWAHYYGPAQDEFQFPFNNGFIATPWKAQIVRKVVDDVEAALPPEAWPNAHTGNFDEWRVATRFGEPGARSAAVMLLTLRGTPLLYYGEEIGMQNNPIPPELEKDPFGKRVGLSRDPQRTPMQWDPGPNAGFAPLNTPRLWLPIASNYRQINVETELADPGSMLNLYRKLLAYRKVSPALQAGSYTPVDGVPEDTFVYIRQLEGERVLVALNFSDQAQRVELADLGQGDVKISTHLDREGPVEMGDIQLRPNESLVIRY